MTRVLYALVAVVAAWLGYRWLWIRPLGGEAAPPIDIARDPIQQALETPQIVRLERGGRPFLVHLLHAYDIAGYVLSAASYDLTWTNDFFDVDLGMAWGDHVDAIREKCLFDQGGRWLHWHFTGPTTEAERTDIARHVGNEHLIPKEGSRRVAHAIRWADRGDTVRIKGFLVSIEDDAGRTLAHSSLSREDTGGGACEIVWVDEIQINGKNYK